MLIDPVSFVKRGRSPVDRASDGGGAVRHGPLFILAFARKATHPRVS